METLEYKPRSYSDMYFVTKVKFSNLLFYGLDINNTSEMVGACVITFVFAMLCELLMLLQMYLGLRMNENPLAAVQDPQQSDSSSDPINSHSDTRDEALLLSSLRFPVSLHQIQTRRLVFHALGTVTYLLHLVWGYLLMLLVMSYSVWLTIAVLTGFGVGYFIFAALKEKLQRKYSQQPTPQDTSVSDDSHQHHSPDDVMHM